MIDDGNGDSEDSSSLKDVELGPEACALGSPGSISLASWTNFSDIPDPPSAHETNVFS